VEQHDLARREVVGTLARADLGTERVDALLRHAVELHYAS
jgi:hypothetical protein